MPQLCTCYFESCHRSFQRPANLKRHIALYHGANVSSVIKSSNFNPDPQQPQPLFVVTPERSYLSEEDSYFNSMDKKSSECSNKNNFSNTNASLSVLLNPPPSVAEAPAEDDSEALLVLSKLESVGVDVSSCSPAGQKRIVSLLSKSALDAAVAQMETAAETDYYFSKRCRTDCDSFPSD